MQIFFQFLWSIMGLFQFWTVVDAYERGVVLRLGKYNKTINPGFHWLIPLGIDRALTHEVILTTRMLEEQSLTTDDGKKVVVSAMIAYTIEDIKKILLEVEEAETVLENYVYGAISNLIMCNDYWTIEQDEWLESLTNEVTIQAADLGMVIHKVVIVNLSEIRTLRLMLPSQTVELG
jgi:hypothetical protein